jgi:hypothetical protein
MALLPNAGYRLFIHEVSRSHTQTHHSRDSSSGRVIGPTQRPLLDNTHHSQETDIFAPAGLEPTISVVEGQQTYALERAATRIGSYKHLHTSFKCYIKSAFGC